jgi:hypothetical protein
MTYTSRILPVLAAASLLAAAASSRAASLTMTDVSPAAAVNVAFPGIDYTPAPLVGAIGWTFDRSAPENAALAALVPGNSLTTFCIEGHQDVAFQSTNTFSTLLSNLATAPQDNLGSPYAMGANAATLSKFYDAYFADALTDPAHAAAFQLGVWEIIYDNGTDLATGTFKASPFAGDTISAAAVIQAQAWLGGLGAVNPTAHYTLYVLSDPQLQDQLVGVPTGGIPAVPLPAALPMGMSLLAGVGLYRPFRKA